MREGKITMLKICRDEYGNYNGVKCQRYKSGSDYIANNYYDGDVIDETELLREKISMLEDGFSVLDTMRFELDIRTKNYETYPFDKEL